MNRRRTNTTFRTSAACLSGILVLAAWSALPASASGPVVTVLVDFGDGTYRWAEVVLPDSNVTALKATELANAAWGLPPLEVTWYSETWCDRYPRPCAFVSDIGNRNPRDAWWHFYLWNGTSTDWERSPLGASDTDLGDGTTIGWYLATGSAEPAPRVDFRDVHASFRANLRNTGETPGTIPGRVRVLWDANVGVPEIDTAPLVAYGKVFVATRDAVVALDMATGATVWRNDQVGSLLSTPTIYDGYLVVGGTDNRLHALSASTGQEEWSLLLEGSAQRSTGIASSPAIFEGRAYLGTFNETEGGRGRVVAVDLDGRTVAWSYETASVHMSQPAIAEGALYVGLMGTCRGAVCVAGYDPPHGLLSLWLNGTLNWFYPTDGSVASSPLLAEDRVYFTAKDGYLYALDRSGALAWRREIGASTSSPALAGGRIYVGSGGLDGTGAVFAFDLTGTEVWDANPGGPVQASLVTDGTLVCGATNTASGSVFCLHTADGRLVWRFTPSPHQYILGSPVVVGDTVYAPSDNGHLYALERAEGDFPGGAIGLEIVLLPLALAAGLFAIVVVLRRRRKRGSHG